MTAASARSESGSWHRVEPDQLVEWVGASADGAPSPIFALAEPATVAESIRGLVPSDFRNFLRIRPESGAAELRFSATTNLRMPQLVDLARNIAIKIDDRKFEEAFEEPTVRPRHASLVPVTASAEFTSTVSGLAVIGPGGRLFIDTNAREVDIVVRRRLSAREGTWRRPQDVVRRTLAVVAGAPDRANLAATFGYFEASKYQRQLMIRPTFAFLVDILPGQFGPHWRTMILEPATEADGVPPWDGLENWSEEEGT